MDHKKQCQDCVHFLQHYVRGKDKLHFADSHCAPHGRSRQTGRVCGSFQERDLEREDQLQSAEKCLNRIARQIEELTLILKLLTE